MSAVKIATPSDRDEIARLHFTSHTTSFAPFASPQWLESLKLVDYEAKWRDWLDDQRPGSRTFISLDEGGAVVGVVRIYPDSERGEAQLGNMHVSPELAGAGIGRTLMTAALGFMRDQGFVTARLGVVQENRRARRFYESHGWVVDELLPTGQEGVPIATYRLDL